LDRGPATYASIIQLGDNLKIAKALGLDVFQQFLFGQGRCEIGLAGLASLHREGSPLTAPASAL
jgi:hypothetical protein